MTFFMAGISLHDDLCRLKPINLCLKLISIFPRIVQEAEQALGKDVIVVIALQEYALTKQVIPNAIKKEMLVALKKAIAPFNNVFLVPGSFFQQQNLAEAPRKSEKMKKNYEQLLKNVFLE